MLWVEVPGWEWPASQEPNHGIGKSHSFHQGMIMLHFDINDADYEEKLSEMLGEPCKIIGK